MEHEQEEPCYVISVAARLLGMHVQTLRYYERAGLIEPFRSRGNIRLYSEQDIERLREVKRLMEVLGVNLAGAEVILRMRDRLAELEQEREALVSEVARLREERPN
ncbi:MAG TPA: MerR family transcriptional regulator [Dehalococcoidia bacterium]|nr:MerR family transcriptional regulator [Dehalococcoidia bacterium]